MAGLRRGHPRGEALRRRAPARVRAKGRQVGWSTQPFERQCSTSPTSGGSSRRQQRRAERGARGMREGAGGGAPGKAHRGSSDRRPQCRGREGAEGQLRKPPGSACASVLPRREERRHRGPPRHGRGRPSGIAARQESHRSKRPGHGATRRGSRGPGGGGRCGGRQPRWCGLATAEERRGLPVQQPPVRLAPTRAPRRGLVEPRPRSEGTRRRGRQGDREGGRTPASQRLRTLPM